jgi:hypothetical protein
VCGVTDNPVPGFALSERTIAENLSVRTLAPSANTPGPTGSRSGRASRTKPEAEFLIESQGASPAFPICSSQRKLRHFRQPAISNRRRGRAPTSSCLQAGVVPVRTSHALCVDERQRQRGSVSLFSFHTSTASLPEALSSPFSASWCLLLPAATRTTTLRNRKISPFRGRKIAGLVVEPFPREIMISAFESIYHLPSESSGAVVVVST